MPLSRKSISSSPVPQCKEGLSPTTVQATVSQPGSTAAASGGTTEDASLVLKAMYFYDPGNRRVTRWVLDDGTYYYSYDGWQEVQQYAPGTTNELTQYVWGEQLDELLAYRVSPSAGNWTNYYIAEGGAHCPSRVLDESGTVVEVQEYDPYGKTTYYSGGVAYAESQVGNKFGWKAVTVDKETRLLYMRNRYFDPGMGRFVSRDPLGNWGDLLNDGNGYCYAGSRPLVAGDPYGLQTLPGLTWAQVEYSNIFRPPGSEFELTPEQEAQRDADYDKMLEEYFATDRNTAERKRVQEAEAAFGPFWENQRQQIPYALTAILLLTPIPGDELLGGALLVRAAPVVARAVPVVCPPLVATARLTWSYGRAAVRTVWADKWMAASGAAAALSGSQEVPNNFAAQAGALAASLFMAFQ